MEHYWRIYLEKVDRNDTPKTLNIASENKSVPKKKCSFCFNKFGKFFPHLLKDCHHLKSASPEDRAKYASSYDGKIMPAALKALMVSDNQPTQIGTPHTYY